MSRYVKDANGVWHAVAGLEAIDSTPTQGSTAAVSSGGVYASEQTIKQALSTEASVRAKNGAHNLLPFSIAYIKSVNTVGTWSGNAYTVSGVTFTLYNDGSIKVNGTASADIQFRLQTDNHFVPTYLNGQDVILTGCPSSGTTGTVAINVQGYNKVDTGQGVQFTIDTTNKTYGIPMIIYIASGSSVSNGMFYPMLRLALDTYAEFTPYSKTNQELTQGFDMEKGNLGTTHTLGAYSYLVKRNNMVTFSFYLTATSNVARWGLIGTIPSGFRPTAGITYVVARVGSNIGILTIDENGLFKTDQYDINSGDYIIGSVTYVCDN